MVKKSDRVYSEKDKKKEVELTCVCGKKNKKVIGGRYEKLIFTCPYCNEVIEYTKSEVDES